MPVAALCQTAVALPDASIASAGPLGSTVLGSSVVAPDQAPPLRTAAMTERVLVVLVKSSIHSATASPSAAVSTRGPTRLCVLSAVAIVAAGAGNDPLALLQAII